MHRLSGILLCFIAVLSACSKDEQAQQSQPDLVIKLIVDSTQVRLGNTGNPAVLPSGHAGQHPRFNAISAHYLELAPNAFTQIGQGAILYHAPETTLGGATAIDFDQSKQAASDGVFLRIPLNEIPAGTYEWVRLSVSYQNYDVTFHYNGTPYTGTIVSFVGYNTYIRNLILKNQTIGINANKLQGFWGIETPFSVVTGQSPPGSTTVPNPLFATSPIPQGSCVVTGQFAQAITISGTETADVVMKLSLSTNNSFEWIDTNGNGLWDIDTTGAEQVVDMGLRGLIPMTQ
jgi:hypothetical protein